jgi:Bacterioferritin (cytochrome b1)
MENTTAINELNAFLKGEYMAIDIYEDYIRTVDSTNTQNILQSIQSDHKNHAKQISDRIKNLGGVPSKSVGFTGKIAENINSLKHINKSDDNSILREAYSGEDKGIKMAEEIVKGDLDTESASMINIILETDKQHLNLLKNNIS